MSEIITEELAFTEHMPFPPYLSTERMISYERNLERFKGTYNTGKFIKIKNLQGKIEKFPILTENFFKLSTLKMQGLLLNEKPIFSFKNNGEYSKLLTDTINDSSFWLAFTQAYRNFSSLGTGILYLSYKQGKPYINSVNPKHLFKIVEPENIENVKCYVLAQPLYKVDYKQLDYIKIERMRLLFHYKGYYIERIFGFNEDGYLKELLFEQKIDTGLTDFAVFPFENCPATDEIYGMSDYDNIKDVVSIYEQILTLINAVLIKNINPIVQVPSGVLIENEQTGEIEGPENGSVVEVDTGEIKYITYDMQVSDISSYLGVLLNEIGVQSEMSKTFLTGEFTSNLSGEAIKSLLKAPLDKIGRSIDQIDDVLKRLFVQVLYLKSVECSTSDIVIKWRDGISETVDTGVERIPTEEVTEDLGGVVNE